MIDANKLLGNVIGSGAVGGFATGLLGGGAVGLMTSKKGRKLGKSALKVGGIAAVGALAYHAYSRYRSAATAQGGASTGSPAPTATSTAALQPPPPGSGFLPDTADVEATQSIGVTLIRAMIAAARSDGEIDVEESRRLFSRMETADLGAEERAFLLRELSQPVSMDTLVEAATSPELAAEIYAASLMAIEVSNSAESAYLQLLAARLELDPGLVAELERTVSANAAHPPGIHS